GDGIVSRYGGEEFVVVLKYMSEDKVRAIAQKILQTIRETPYCLGAEKCMQYFVTIGVSMLETLDLDKHIKEADDNLYKGKNQSKNCVVFSDEV
ncbi:MAG: GGDEF domain-containing protein, partial [Cellulosilyticaceae bacterium]